MLLTVPYTKRYEYWNHFVAMWALDRYVVLPEVTAVNLWEVRQQVWRNDVMWAEIIIVQDGLSLSPEQMAINDLGAYEFCQGYFWGHVYRTMAACGLIVL